MGLQEIQNERFENSEYWPKQDSEVLKFWVLAFYKQQPLKSVSFVVFLAHANVSSIRPATVENGESKCSVGLNRRIGLVRVD